MNRLQFVVAFTNGISDATKRNVFGPGRLVTHIDGRDRARISEADLHRTPVAIAREKALLAHGARAKPLHRRWIAFSAIGIAFHVFVESEVPAIQLMIILWLVEGVKAMRAFELLFFVNLAVNGRDKRTGKSEGLWVSSSLFMWLIGGQGGLVFPTPKHRIQTSSATAKESDRWRTANLLLSYLLGLSKSTRASVENEWFSSRPCSRLVIIL